jgi:pyruvate/2-oxoglutarate dehydrogenase complex dihydrolipoamide acyltransferase (E2) component
MPDVTLPRLADTLVEGTVSRWLKRPGERVALGEPLVEVETDKVNSELESPYEGVLTEIVAAEGTTVPVGDVIARIEAGDAAVQSGPEPEPATEDAPGPGSTGMTGLRRRIAERMQEARATIPQGSCSVQVDLSRTPREGSWTALFVEALAIGVHRVRCIRERHLDRWAPIPAVRQLDNSLFG